VSPDEWTAFVLLLYTTVAFGRGKHARRESGAEAAVTSGSGTHEV
jgi:hypothetical protein